MLTIVKTPINSTDRREHATAVPVEEVQLPWQTVDALLNDPDFVAVTIVSKRNVYTISKDSSW